MRDDIRAHKNVAHETALVIDSDGLNLVDKLFAGILKRAEARTAAVRTEDARRSEDGEDGSGGLYINVGLRDGTNIAFASIADIGELPNAGKREIQTVRIRTVKTAENMAELTLGGRNYYTFQYSVAGDVKTVGHLSALFDELLASFRPWYAPLAKLEGAAVGLAVTILLVTVLIAAAVYSSTLPVAPDTPPIRLSFSFVVFFVAGFSIPFVAGGMWNIVRGRLFPLVIFAINAGKTKHEQLKWAQRIAYGMFAALLGLGAKHLLNA